MRVSIYLTDKDKAELEWLEKRDLNWRVRERARSVLYLAAGERCVGAARQQGLALHTVCDTRKAWLAEGFACLVDKPRSGAPPKLSPVDVQRLVDWARASPCSSSELLAKHVAAGGQPVSSDTLIRALRQAGLVWKRTRHSLKKTG